MISAVGRLTNQLPNCYGSWHLPIKALVGYQMSTFAEDAREEIDDDRLFDALANERRRRVLSILCEYDATVALADLADEVAVREKKQPITEIPPGEVKRVYMLLYHSHIPKMADANLVRYDQARDRVTWTVSEDRIRSLLDI